MPKSYTNTLFSEESEKLEQSRLLNLISVDIDTWGTATSVQGLTTLYDVTNMSDYIVDECIRLVGQPGIFKVLAKHTTTVTLDKAPTVSQTEVKVKQVMNIVDSNYSVTYGGTLYYAFPVKYDPPTVGVSGTTEMATITVANADRAIMYYVERDPKWFVGNRVEVKKVFENILDFIYTPDASGAVVVTNNPTADSDSYLRESHTIDAYAANETSVQFALKPSIRVDVKLPRRRFLKGSCYFRFKDPNSCQYDGLATECRKTWDNCVTLGNQEHFGGFPGVNSSRRIWL
jgi:lambda family phage minor tail protein L